MVYKYLLLCLSLFIIVSCISRNEEYRVPDFSHSINFDYGIKKIAEFEDDTSLVSYEYYNNDHDIVEIVGYEYRTKFYYDPLGQLSKKFNCRMYNCEIGWWSFLKYDEHGNFIGSFNSKDSTISFDTVKVEQINFYDSDNQLVKELIDSGRNFYGEDFEVWKYYQYQNGLIKKETEIRNDDTVWVGTHNYNSNNDLTRIEYWREDKYRFIAYKYSTEGKLIGKYLESNLYELTDSTIISLNNSSTVYEYDSHGRLLKESTYNHRGELYRKFVYRYFSK